MNHTQKVKLARKGITSQERQAGVSIFNTAFWNNRVAQIKARVAKREAASKAKS